MLTDIIIENYRLFGKFRLDGMNQINLLVGANNSGKSSLLEAIYLLVNQNEPKALFDILDMRGEVTPDFYKYGPRIRGGYQISHIFRGHILREDHPVKIYSLKKSAASLTISLLENYDKNGEQRIRQKMLFDEIEDDTIEPELRLEFSYNKNVIRSVLISEDGLLARRVVSGPNKGSRFVTTDYLDQREVAILWDQITLTPKEDKVLEALQILEPAVERISFTSQQSPKSGILLRIKGNDYPVPSMGDGMRRILVLAASLVSSENGALLVDEIDTGLHYKALTKMWHLMIETAKRFNVQVFATTHSWDCLASFQKALSEAEESNIGTVFRLERKNGQIDYVAYTGEEIAVAVEHDIEVR